MRLSLAFLAGIGVLVAPGCDGGTDADLSGTDADGDGITADEDCDDTDAAVGAGAVYYADDDGDGYGDVTQSVAQCGASTTYVAQAGDCNDADPAYHPGASEVCEPVDYNCDGAITWVDEDGDGYGACEECDDANPAVSPAAPELCNDVDDDCDESVDEDPTDAAAWYADVDGDGWGDEAAVTTACDAPEGTVATSGDCNDALADVSPSAIESCNGFDDDCDTVTDEDDAIDTSTWYADSDSDGYGDAATTAVACAAPGGFVGHGEDCDDTDAAVNPDGTESCNGIDDDCDGTVDQNAIDPSTWYADDDGDTFGDAGSTTRACDQPGGYVADATDCDDGEAATYPRASEACDGEDNDCDGIIDEGLTANEFYADADDDGYGDADDTTTACAAPAGYSEDDSDCDDADDNTYPGASELCDAIDNDCDGSVDIGGTCPCDVAEYDGRTYMFCSVASAWEDAQTSCQSYGYEMVDILDEEENTWVVDSAESASSGQYWIGLNDLATEGTFEWSSGESLSYENYASGQPSGGESEDCTRFNSIRDTWYDHTCSDALGYICEI